jgi:hypothetical protein
MTGTGTANTLNGESGLIFDGTNLGIGAASPDQLLQVGSESYGANAIIKTQVDGSDVGNFDSGLHMRSHDDNFGGSIVLESRSGTNDIVNFKYHNNSSAGVTAMAIDAVNGNVGIGTTSPGEKLSILGGHISVGDSTGVAGTEFLLEGYREIYNSAKYGNTSIRTTYDISSNASDMLFYTASGGTNTAEAMRIDSAGNLLIGTDTYATGAFGSAFGINISATRPQVVLKNETYSTDAFFGLADNLWVGTQDAINLIFATNDTERMRINSSGYTKYTTVGGYVNLSGNYHETIGSHANIAYYMYNTNSGGDVLFLNSNNENSSNFFLAGYSDSAARHNIYIYSNGDIKNRNNSYGSISDQKLKQDIEDANSQWEDIKAIQFRKYRWKQDVASNADAPYQLGVIAQELESAGMHGLVEETDDKEFYDEVVLDENGNNVTQREERLTGESTKSVKYSILTLKALKALQEAMERIETLEAKITTLENA